MEYTEETLPDGMIKRTYSNGAIEIYKPVQDEQIPPNPTISKLKFLSLFTNEELATFLSTAKTNVAVEVFKMLLDAAKDVNLTDDRTIGGVQMLEQLGILASGRANEILSFREENS